MFYTTYDSMILKDGAEHGRLRRLVSQAFTLRTIQNLVQFIEALSEEFLEKAMKQPEVNFMDAYCLPIPIRVISEMLGFTRKESEIFIEAATTIIYNPRKEGRFKIYFRLRGFFNLMKNQIKKKRKKPTDDLVSRMVEAEEDGERLSDDEILGMIFLLILAGFETTANLIGSSTIALLREPDLKSQLAENPDLYPLMVEEMLRYHSPAPFTFEHFATEDCEISGYPIKRGDYIIPMIASANRDETVFENPDKIDLHRSHNKHLALGHGIHSCLGGPLARLEAKIALKHLLTEAPNLRLARPDEKIEMSYGLLRRIESLPMCWE